MSPSNPFWPRHAMVFFGGGGGGAAATPVIPAPAAPPPSTTSVEVTQAKLEAARLNKQRQGINSTILGNQGVNPAGQSRPAQGALGGAAGGKATVLGGG